MKAISFPFSYSRRCAPICRNDCHDRPPRHRGDSDSSWSVFTTAYEGAEINPYRRTYREYNSFLFVKSGKRLTYTSIDGVFIHKAVVRQKLYTARTMNSSIFTHIEFHAYVKIADEKIFLMRSKRKIKLLRRAKDVARFLNTSVID